MTVEKVSKLTQEFLRGDNSKAEATPLLIELALQDVCRFCIPNKLVAEVGDDEDAPEAYFRQIEDAVDEAGAVFQRYIVIPEITDATTEINIEEELIKAVVYFLCSYLTNKSDDEFIREAKNIIAIYNSNRLYE